MSDIEAYYLGCWEEAGHRFLTPDMRSATYKKAPPTPWGYRLDSKEFDVPDWHVKKLDGWTAIGTRDRTVDTRPGSISVFAFHADLTDADALALARKTFPAVFARLWSHGFGRAGGGAASTDIDLEAGALSASPPSDGPTDQQNDPIGAES